MMLRAWLRWTTLGATVMMLAACFSKDEPVAPVPTSSSATSSGAGGAGDAGGAGGAVATDAASTATGAGGAPSYEINTNYESWHSPDVKASAYFAPHDDVEAVVLGELARAKKSLRLAFFNIRLDQVKTVLEQKVKAGVDVHVLLDKKQQDESYNTMFEDLQAVGVPVTLIENTSAADATLHDKFTVIDGERVMTGSANFSYTALHVSDETLIVAKGAELAARFEAEFDELVAKGDAKSLPYGNEKLRAWMGPEDSLATKIGSALDAAKTSAFVALFDLNTDTLVDSLVAARERGVNVIVVLDKKQADDVTGTADEVLSAAGVKVLKALNSGSNQAEMHHKYAVLDHKTVLVGSNNWTNLGSYFNDENLLVVDDVGVATRFEGNFGELLTTYGGEPAKLGLNAGMIEVTLRVSNVTLGPGLELRVFSEKGGPFENTIPLTKSELLLNVPAGTRLDYSYKIVNGKSDVAVELGGAKIAHSFTVPYYKGPHLVVDAFVP
jgi:phosphatidylserine/phosphatidylglycerophosphate/cardiolipin synthase-like enzyme